MRAATQLAGTMNRINLLNWNVNWTGSSERRAPAVLRHIVSREPDVACLTEIQDNMLSFGGFSLLSDPNHGYKKPPGHHKVSLWSREEWTDIDLVGSATLPPGRFVSGVTQGIRFVGVCIPWKWAHVATGKANRRIWEDHLAFLTELHPLIEDYLRAPQPVCLLGDFNQRIPRQNQETGVFNALEGVLDLGLRPLSAGIRDGDGELLIDHVAVSANLEGEISDLIPKWDKETELSDHTGTMCQLRVRT